MPNRDRTGPMKEGPATGKGMGPCGTTEKQLEENSRVGPVPVETTEKQLEDNKELGRGRGGPGKGLGRGQGRGCRRKGPNGVTYFT